MLNCILSHAGRCLPITTKDMHIENGNPGIRSFPKPARRPYTTIARGEWSDKRDELVLMGIPPRCHLPSNRHNRERY
jgi:hypothetical protein